MSQRALEKLQSLWKDLVFGRVTKTVTKPEDVLSISVYGTVTTHDGAILRNHVDYYVRSNRVEDIPPEDLWRTDISWRHYYGFTQEGIYFQKDGYNELDLDIDLTMTFGNYGNHHGGWHLPEKGTLICGVPTDAPKGRRFAKWFVCPPGFAALFDTVMTGNAEGHSEAELAGRLITGRYPDMYWAIVRLVLFDNVQAFVDQLRMQRCAPHPYYGQEYESPDYTRFGGHNPKVDWNGMFLPRSSDQYVHEISYRLEEPNWWGEFKRIAKEKFPEWSPKDHPGCGGRCRACQAEGRWDDEEGWEFSDLYSIR